MRKPSHYHEVPVPSPEAAGRNHADPSSSELSAERMATQYQPRGASRETKVATLSRFACRLIDRLTGKAYAANDLPEIVQQKTYAGEPVNAVRASLTVNPTGTNNSVDYTAVVYGIAGENVSVAYTAPVQTGLDVSVSGDAITVACGTKHRMVVTGTLSPDATGTLVYAGDDNDVKMWSSDGTRDNPPSSGSYTVIMSFMIAETLYWKIIHYTDGGEPDGIWISEEYKEFPDGLSYVIHDTETGTPTVTAALPTAQQVIDAVEADAEASDLVTPAANGTVTGAVAAVAAAHLSGGVDGTPAKLGRTATDGTDVWTALVEDNTTSQHSWVKTFNG